MTYPDEARHNRRAARLRFDRAVAKSARSLRWWTTTQEAFVLAHYATHGDQWCSDNMPGERRHSAYGVRWKAMRLGVSRLRE